MKEQDHHGITDPAINRYNDRLRELHACACEKFSEFISAGSVVVTLHILSELSIIGRFDIHRGVFATVVSRLQILALALEGNRAGQMLHIAGLARGSYGFKKDLAQARHFRVLYGILGSLEQLFYISAIHFFEHWYIEIY